ncbi:MAG: uracil-DNA glycosylase [Silicimonas sp.]|nr:uracil-DNA glycosylase [Silicimonas sp.]
MKSLGVWGTLPFFKHDWPKIKADLAAETRTVLPPAHQRFAALERTHPDQARVVILGQDPYPTPGHANGLAFSVAKNVALPKSLKNIYTELVSDIGAAPPNGDLGFWADQGVLLLNTALSVPAGEAGGHAKLGWSLLITQVLAKLNEQPRAWVLWGKHAQGFRPTGPDHLILESAHPSPLSAYRGFFGSKPFSQINNWLISRGETPIRWA